MKKFLLLVVVSLFGVSGFAQTPPQKQTANLFNNISEAYLNLWAQKGPAYVAADDGSYAISKKLSSSRGSLLLLLQDFRFTIPADATIENIVVSARRFKKGKGSITDYFATLVRQPVLPGSNFNPYGVRFTDPANYPSVEAEVLYTQAGSGSNGGVSADQTYQWTPEMINQQGFGVRIDTYAPQRGSVEVFYDLVQITVSYSVPDPGTLPAVSRKTSSFAENKILPAPVVFPNPFKSKTNIRFTAAESGRTVVELYNLSGAKIRTLFSGDLIQGQQYNFVAGDAQLTKGIYVYMIRYGKQKSAGRMIKIE